MRSSFLRCALISFATVAVASCSAEWETVEAIGKPTARHEAAFVEFEGKFYLLGGRRINPADCYDPATNTWTAGSLSPAEVHHFQPVVYKDRILLMGVMTGKYPTETPVDRILEYSPSKDAWSWGHEIPEGRRRGGAGVVVYAGKIYVVGGIQRGHMGGYVNWLDEYDPETGAWKVLPDAPHARDHFQATVLDGKLYAAGGRRTSNETKQTFDLVVPEVDVYDFATGGWSVLPEPLPTPRAGNSTMALAPHILVIGGESMAQKEAHSEVEAYDTANGKWEAWPSLVRGRHGSGAFLHESCLYTCSGSGNRGGSPELETLERFPIGSKK